MVIVDTTVWVDYLNGISTREVEWFDRESERQRLGLLDLTVCEVLQGVATDAAAAQVFRTLRRFEIFDTGGIALARRLRETIATCAPAGGQSGRPSITSSRRSVSSTRMRCSTAIAMSTPSRTSSDCRSFAPAIQDSRASHQVMSLAPCP